MSLRLEPEEYNILRGRVLDRDGWKCRNPQCKLRNNLHCHHIVYRSEMGVDETWNIVTICSDCHDLIHAYKMFIDCAPGNPVGPGGGADGELIFTRENE